MEFEVPKALEREQLEVLAKARKGKVRAGVNEVTKAVERGKARLVLIARDVSPPEIVMHLPPLCREKDVPYSFVSARKELGEKAGLAVPTSSVAVLDAGPAQEALEALARQLKALTGAAAEKTAAGAAKEKKEAREAAQEKEGGEKEKPSAPAKPKPSEAGEAGKEGAGEGGGRQAAGPKAQAGGASSAGQKDGKGAGEKQEKEEGKEAGQGEKASA